ncbi:GIY-YIG nuclease family protein [Algoriphagus marincola]|uniref:GIY-YIG nuclease family protein n=1 Tax=Algoriphagus marincola TaxID=264027 RepID=A0ABS7N1L2_9BACT|nr:GIY-YIG nuclease family protein [Algoriphagus marincola]MBY5950220.1 GIY-YIG nuclease family protein [Algoriphagus marincola]
MSFFVYIIYSPSKDRFYVGLTENYKRRISEHNSGFFKNSSTKVARDWITFILLPCKSRSQALKIESHIKKAKSRRFIENLRKYPEIAEKLLSKYK